MPRALDILVLVASSAAWLLAAALELRGGSVVWGEWALPALCWSHRLFDVSCPGCGLTRGMVALAHGDLSGALGANVGAPLVGVFLLGQVAYRVRRLLEGS